ncbi:hypothetical protein AA102526_2691 [Asaia lannensis NBRC 102526]|nr:hypothetical protein AA102526_2691 [Asaia lannensis NBRC 102526]
MRYPRSILSPDGCTFVTVRDAEQEARVRARLEGRPEPAGKGRPPRTVMRPKGRSSNVRKP